MNLTINIIYFLTLCVAGSRGLLSYLRCLEGSGTRTHDPNGLLNVKLSGCVWATELAPTMSTVSVPTFMLNEPEEIEGFFGETIGSSACVRELTGVFRRGACIPAQGDMAVASAEVVCLSYRIKQGLDGESERDRDGDRSNYSPNNSPPPTAHTEPTPLEEISTPSSSSSVVSGSKVHPETPIEGYLDWCERGTRSRLNGSITAGGNDQSLLCLFCDVRIVFVIIFSIFISSV